MNLNAVILAGSLAEDPAPGARKHDLCTFTLAFQGPFAADRGAAARSRDFVPVVAFGRTAEACLRHLKKGSRVIVDGRLRDDRWRSQSGGGTSRITVVCDRIHFVSGLKKETETAAGPLPEAARAAQPISVGSPPGLPTASL
jgi:single-strand DNA-binding protein